MSGLIGLYIHIPFCRQKCRYCDFASYAGKENLIDTYLQALAAEAARYKGNYFDTLYIGGGTPSLLSVNQLQKLIQIISQNFRLVGDFSESTIEANPESLTREKLDFLRQQGINRLSIGLQSFDDTVLKHIGRIHTVDMFLRAYENARAAGFENINVDLIAGLPGQTKIQFLEGVKKLIALAPQHISVYGLQIEEGTPFAYEGLQADEDLLREELEQIHEDLPKAGYVHYEISNFARAGKESKHNSNYWQNGEYLGLGAAAASYQKGVRRSNTSDLCAYINQIKAGQTATVFSEQLTGQAHEGETILLGLRQLGGICLTANQQNLFAKEIKALKARGLVEQKGNLLKLSKEGLFLANQVFMTFVGPFEKNETDRL